jgi:hypothetical protein
MVKEDRKVGGELGFKGEDVIIVGIQPPPGQEKDSKNLLYPTDTPSISIATDSSTFVGLDLASAVTRFCLSNNMAKFGF